MTILDGIQARVVIAGADQKSALRDLFDFTDTLDASPLLVREVAEQRVIGLHREKFVHSTLISNEAATRSDRLLARNTSSVRSSHLSRRSSPPASRSSR